MSEITQVPAQDQQIPNKKEKKVRKPRSVPMKILMGFIAFILCIVMFAVSLVGVAILDIRAVVSRNGISQIVSMLISGQPSSAPFRPALAAGVGRNMGFVQGDTSAGNDMNGMLVDWAYEMIKDKFGDQLPVSRDQVQTFVEESTVKDFVADKVAGLVEDFYSGENTTTITVDEITQLIEENKDVIKEQFGVTITQKDLEQVDQMLEQSQMLEPIEEQGLMGYIQQSMGGSFNPAPETPGDQGDNQSGNQGEKPSENQSGSQSGKPSITPGIGNDIGQPSSPMEMMNEIMELVRTATSYTTVAILGAMFLLLLVLLFFVTGRSIPATLADTGVVLTLTGLIFSAPTALCLFNQSLWIGILGGTVGGISTLFFKAASTVNFTVLGLGVALIVAAIVVKIVKNSCANKQAA